MAKLKFDRLINISLESIESVTVPKDELWRVSAFTNSNGAEMNGKSGYVDKDIFLMSSGCKLKPSMNMVIQGMAFKAVEE